MPWRDTSQLVKQKVSHRQKRNCASHNPCDTNQNENLFSDTRLHKTTSSLQFVKIPAAMMRKSPIRRGFQPPRQRHATRGRYSTFLSTENRFASRGTRNFSSRHSLPRPLHRPLVDRQ